LPNSTARAAEHTAVYQGVVKLAFPSGRFRPYVLGGLGAARSSLQSYISPGAGSSWADTGTSEVRQTFDSVKYGVAWSWGAGLDWFMAEHFFLGLELRETYLSQRLHQPTSFGASQGIAAVRDPKSLTAVLLKVGVKFGA
jgi:opacity protein-like surface antigen